MGFADFRSVFWSRKIRLFLGKHVKSQFFSQDEVVAALKKKSKASSPYMTFSEGKMFWTKVEDSNISYKKDSMQLHCKVSLLGLNAISNPFMEKNSDYIYSEHWSILKFYLPGLLS